MDGEVIFAALLGLACGLGLSAWVPAIPAALRRWAGGAVALTFGPKVSPPAANKPIFDLNAFVLGKDDGGPPKEPMTLSKVGRGIVGVILFLWRWRVIIVAVLALWFMWKLVAPVYHFVTCPFGGAVYCLESKRAVVAERDAARVEVHTQQTLNQRDTEIARTEVHAAVRRANIILNSQVGHDEILAATPAHEAPIDADLVRSWSDAVDRLCYYPTQDGDRPDQCPAGNPR